MERIAAWSTPTAKPVKPGPGELHLWLIDLDIPPLNFEPYLSAEERDRAKRIVNAVGSRRFVTARGSMRKILGDYLEVNAGAIGFRYGSTGKPEMAHPDSDLRFNLTHSGHLALLAITCQSEIGVDIEPLRTRPSLLAIARKIFGERMHETLAALEEPQRIDRFFQLWTRLEARAKCQGNGVFSQPDHSIPAVNFEPETGWLAAVAVSGGVPEAAQWRSFRLTPADF